MPKLNTEDDLAISELYKEGKNFNDILRITGAGTYRVKRALNKYSVPVRENKKRKILSLEQRKELCNLYVSDSHSFQDLMVKYDVSSIVVTGCLKEFGLKAKRHGFSKLKKDSVKFKNILKDFYELKTFSGLAKKYGVSRDAITQALKLHGLSEEQILMDSMFSFKKEDGSIIYMRSDNEVIFAENLKNAELHWKYEAFSIQLDEKSFYTPDFCIYDRNEKPRFLIDCKSKRATFRFKNHNGRKSSSDEDIRSIITKSFPGSEFIIVLPDHPHIIVAGIKSILSYK